MHNKISRRTKNIIILFMIVASFFSPFFFHTSAQDTPVQTVSYSFNQVRASMGKVKITSGSVSEEVDGSTMMWSKDGHGSVKWAITQPFFVGKNGEPIDETKALSEAEIYARDTINNTVVEYKLYNYAVDFIVYTSMIMPSGTSLPIKTLTMDGWKSSDDSFSENKLTVTDSNNHLLVMEEVAPAGVTNEKGWAPALGFKITTSDFQDPYWTRNVYGTFYNDYNFKSEMSYSAESIDVDKVLATMGGKNPIFVQPEISVTLKPSLKQGVDFGDGDVQIFAAILEATCKKTNYGTVQNDYATASSNYKADAVPQIPDSLKSSEKSGTEPITKQSPQLNSGEKGGVTYTVIAEPESNYNNVSFASISQGLTVGTSLPMYVSGTNEVTKNITSELKLIADAPDSVSIKPTLQVQPNFDISAKKVICDAKWIKYYDPRTFGFGLAYPDQADEVKSKTLTINPVVKMKVLNTFIITRVNYAVVVSVSATNVFALKSGGMEMQNATEYGTNAAEILDPNKVYSEATTPEEAKTDLQKLWDNAASWWDNQTKALKDLFGFQMPDLTTTLVIVIVIIVIIAVVALVIRSITKKGGVGKVIATAAGGPAAGKLFERAVSGIEKVTRGVGEGTGGKAAGQESLDLERQKLELEKQRFELEKQKASQKTGDGRRSAVQTVPRKPRRSPGNQERRGSRIEPYRNPG